MLFLPVVSLPVLSTPSSQAVFWKTTLLWENRQEPPLETWACHWLYFLPQSLLFLLEASQGRGYLTTYMSCDLWHRDLVLAILVVASAIMLALSYMQRSPSRLTNILNDNLSQLISSHFLDNRSNSSGCDQLPFRVEFFSIMARIQSFFSGANDELNKCICLPMPTSYIK